MKKYCSLIILLFTFLTSYAQSRVYVWKGGKVVHTDIIDSVTYDLNPDKTFNVNGVELKMIKIKAGDFYMGAQKTNKNGINYDNRTSAGYAITHEGPVHKVKLTQDYYMAETEATQALWMAVMGKQPKERWSEKYGIGDDFPANNCTTDEIDQFLEKLNGLLKNEIPEGYELGYPTSAQYEYAARAGEETIEHWWAGTNSNVKTEYEKYVWCRETNDGGLCPVKKLLPNAIGLYGMSGGIYEWTADYTAKGGDAEYTEDDAVDPYQPCDADHKNRIVRGGTFNSELNRCTVSYYDSTESYNKQLWNRGFRVALYKKRN